MDVATRRILQTALASQSGSRCLGWRQVDRTRCAACFDVGTRFRPSYAHRGQALPTSPLLAPAKFLLKCHRRIVAHKETTIRILWQLEEATAGSVQIDGNGEYFQASVCEYGPVQDVGHCEEDVFTLQYDHGTDKDYVKIHPEDGKLRVWDKETK